jgi:N-acetylneuraminic acid mutarotase
VNSLGYDSPTTQPGGTYRASLVIPSNGQYIYLFGGYQRASGGSTRSNMLYRFNTTSSEWAWLGGSTLSWPANYGTINTFVSIPHIQHIQYHIQPPLYIFVAYSITISHTLNIYDNNYDMCISVSIHEWAL